MKQKTTLEEFKERFWIAYIVIMMFSVVALCWSIYVFTLGFHNVDTGCNYRYLSALTGYEVKDRASDGGIYSGEELIHLGYKQYRAAYTDSLVYAFTIGICIFGLCHRIYYGKSFH